MGYLCVEQQVDRLQGQVSELRKCVNTVVRQHAKDIDNLNVIARLSQRASGSIRDELNETKMEVTQGLSLQDLRLSEVENGYKSLNDWAGEMIGRSDPDELWGNLTDKEARISELEEKMEVYTSSGGPGACAGPADAGGESLKEKVDKLEGWVHEMYDWAMTEDAQNEERIERIEN